MIIYNTGRLDVKTFEFTYFNYKAVGIVYLDNAEYEVSIYKPDGTVDSSWMGICSSAIDIKTDIWEFVKEKWSKSQVKPKISWFRKLMKRLKY